MEGTKEETEDRKVLFENHGRQCVKNELKAGGIKFLSNVSTWIGYAAALGFYVNLQVEQYEAIDTKFKEQGKSYVEDLYNRIKNDDRSNELDIRMWKQILWNILQGLQ